MQERYTPDVQRVRVDYERYCQISVRCAELFGEKSLLFFTPATFLLFKRDSHGRISILPLFHYIMRKVSMQQTRIYLSYHDSSGRGHLTERDLEAYVDQVRVGVVANSGASPANEAPRHAHWDWGVS